MAKPQRPKIIRIVWASGSYSRAIALATLHPIRAAGYRPVISTDVSPPNALDYPDEVGFVGFMTRPRVETLRERGLPVVNVSQALGNLPFPSVLPDNRAAGRCAVEHLLRRGYTNIAFAPHGDLVYSRLRGDGVRAAVKLAGARFHEFPEQNTASQPATWERHLPTLSLPAGVVAGDDTVGEALLEAAIRLGIRVPEQLAVVGITNDDIACNTAIVPLSSVDLNPTEIGDRAARLMLRLLAGRRAPTKTILVRPRGVVVRASSDAFATTDPLIAKITEYARDHLAEGVTVTGLAQKFHMSRRSLLQIFRERSDTSVVVLLQRLAVEQSKHLLANTDLSIAQVAANCGYNDVTYFTTLFRRHVGITPGAYRRSVPPLTVK